MRLDDARVQWTKEAAQLAGLAARLVTRVIEDERGCWLWQGPLHLGYGAVGFAGRPIGAHRAAHLAFIGPIPEGWHVDHLCRVRHCIYPGHLEAVTPAVNVWRIPDRGVHTQACPQGHPYDDENTLHHDGRRYCRACSRNRNRRKQPLRLSVCSTCGASIPRPTGRGRPRSYCDWRCQNAAQEARLRAGKPATPA